MINYINDEGIKSPEIEEKVPFELGVKRGKVFVPKYNEEELAAMKRKEEIAEATKYMTLFLAMSSSSLTTSLILFTFRLDDDEEEALAGATTEDLMTLAEILGSNPQEFIMEAYSDPLKYYPPEPPNTTDPQDAVKKVVDNDKNTKDVNLNNIP